MEILCKRRMLNPEYRPERIGKRSDAADTLSCQSHFPVNLFRISEEKYRPHKAIENLKKLEE